jgi:hypothetical protein
MNYHIIPWRISMMNLLGHKCFLHGILASGNELMDESRWYASWYIAASHKKEPLDLSLLYQLLDLVLQSQHGSCRKYRGQNVASRSVRQLWQQPVLIYHYHTGM